MKEKYVAVRLESGVVVWHTWAEWSRLIKGVDLKAARAMVKPIELEGRDDPR